ncbi:hypothetical protein AAULH_13736 [Lactobacillus helveticus MTCC 5463]|nr:hypothetical protein AAULH_13736 [Lactobacillus helveticus MTCC 5463]
MNEFAEFRHNAYAAYSIFDIEKQAFDLLINQKPKFPPEAPDISNKLILDYISDARVFIDSTTNWVKKIFQITLINGTILEKTCIQQVRLTEYVII